MAKIPEMKMDPTLLDIDKALEHKQKLDRPRHYLGMSQIGHECYRNLFYSFRNVKARNIPAKNLRAIEDGYLQEDVMIERLRMLEYIELHTVDPLDDSKQIGFKLLLDHFRGHCDGMIKGIKQAPLTWHVWENKTVNETKFKKLKKLIDEKGEKEALYNWDMIYYAQAQIYMHCSQTTRHYLTVESPGGRDYTSCRTNYSQQYAETIIEKAKTIIFDNWNIPSKLSNSREFFQCKWCDYSGICHDGDIPMIHCKTCRYSEPVNNGERKCLFTNTIIDEKMLHADNCQNHVYNPALIPAKLIEQQADSCIFETEDGFKFANTALVGFPEVKDDLHAIYTSKELFEVVKNVNNLSAESVKISDTFKAENMDTAQKSPEKEWKKQIDPRLKGI